MSIEEKIRELLLADPAVAVMITGNGISRIYPNVLPQGVVFPALDYSMPSYFGTPNLAGPSGTDTCRISFRCWAATYAGARQLGDAVRSTLDGFRGRLTPLKLTILFAQRQPVLYDDAVKKTADIVDFKVSFRSA